jgi:Ca2+-binding RTX toxin-like protein
MTITAAEQLLFELINRARLDPLAEAERLGMGLNDGLAAGTIGAGSKQVLAPNVVLEQAATMHSQWLLDTNTFSHTGAGGSTAHERMQAAGYAFQGNWTSGENLSYYSTTSSSLDLGRTIALQHDMLFRSTGHRTNLMNANFQEMGIGQVVGPYTPPGDTRTFQSTSMLTEKFAKSGAFVFVTGVVHIDTDGNDFYSIGEGVADKRLTAQGISVKSAEAGGYALRLGASAGMVEVVIDAAPAALRLSLRVTDRNVKLDVVDSKEIRVSADTVLHAGIEKATLLGLNNLALTGGAGDEVLIGNAGANELIAGLGNDTVFGGAGADQIFGSAGRNQLFGEDGADFIQAGTGGDLIGGGGGNDTIRGGVGNDTIYGGLGNDDLAGGAGNDQLFGSAGSNIIWGGIGSDTVQGGTGNDTIYGGGTSGNQLFGNDGFDLIFAGDGGDFIGGGAGNDTVRGGLGNDTIYGGLGNDDLAGGAGNDVIFGSAGSNIIWGGAGNDTIHGGTGKDVIVGGPGADTFVFASAAHIGIGAARDVITGFTSGEDRIDLSALNTTFNGTAGVLGGGQASFFYFAAGGLLIGDQNGNGAADWVLELAGAPGVVVGDFIL